MDTKPDRGPVLTVFAILFGLLAISNLMKPLGRGGAGFVFLGTKTSGVENAILGPAFGIFLIIYVIGIWRQKRWVVPIAWVYAAYVPINLTLFTIKTPQNWHGPAGSLFYVAVAIGVSLGSAIILTRRRAQLS